MNKRLINLAVSTAVSFSFGGAALAAKLKVDQNDLGCGPDGPVWCTIQDAIDDALPGDKIEVKDGTYTEDLSILTDGLELKGKGCGKTTIEGVATVPGASFPLAVPNIDIQALGVRIADFTILSPNLNSDPTEYSSGIVLVGTNIKIEKNCFEAGTGDGSQAIQTWALFNASSGLRDISGLHIKDNSFTHRVPATTAGSVDAFEGVFINEQGSPADPLNPVVIEKNDFSGELFRAVATERPYTNIEKNEASTDYAGPLAGITRAFEVRAGFNSGVNNDVEVVKNKVEMGLASFFRGIHVRDGATTTNIEKNDVNDVANNGIEVGNGGANTLEKNMVKNAGNDGVDVKGDANTLEKNDVKDSGRNNYVVRGNSNTVEKNKSKNSVRNGMVVTGGSNTLEKNDVKDSGRFGIRLTGDTNTLEKDKIKDSGQVDAGSEDLKDEGTGNTFDKVKCDTSDPAGLCT